MATDEHSPRLILRSLVIGLTAFLTVVDLFATQAILPSLTRHYGVTPAAMSLAVNASTFGMAVAGLVVGFLSPHIDRRTGILLSLTLLAIPTSLLATAPNLAVFTGLRVAQGLCMASAFALTFGSSRRTMQRNGFRRRLCRLHHGKRRQQSRRPAGLGRDRR
jgi:MFS transporter, YNFM family, putative membrane transport protein